MGTPYDDDSADTAESWNVYFIQDHLYNVIALVLDDIGDDDSAEDGTVVERCWYEPYGVATLAEEDGTAYGTPVSLYGNEHLFTGQRHSPETRTSGNFGLYYYKNRYYDPNLGRFATRDPLVSRIRDYCYANSSPAAGADPLGLVPTSLVVASQTKISYSGFGDYGEPRGGGDESTVKTTVTIKTWRCRKDENGTFDTYIERVDRHGQVHYFVDEAIDGVAIDKDWHAPQGMKCNVSILDTRITHHTVTSGDPQSGAAVPSQSYSWTEGTPNRSAWGFQLRWSCEGGTAKLLSGADEILATKDGGVDKVATAAMYVAAVPVSKYPGCTRLLIGIEYRNAVSGGGGSFSVTAGGFGGGGGVTAPSSAGTVYQSFEFWVCCVSCNVTSPKDKTREDTPE